MVWIGISSAARGKSKFPCAGLCVSRNAPKEKSARARQARAISLFDQLKFLASGIIFVWGWRGLPGVFEAFFPVKRMIRSAGGETGSGGVSPELCKRSPNVLHNGLRLNKLAA
jgi:hypothetical protein